MANITFVLDRHGGADILKNNQKLIDIENQTMSSVLSNIEAQFFQQFGVEGKFEKKQTTGDRTQVIIRAANQRTGAILKANPRWLAQFIDNINI